MEDRRSELVRIDDGGVARPIGRKAGEALRTRRGDFRMLPAPAHVVFLRYVGEDGERDPDDGAVVRLAGEVTGPGTLCDIVALVAQTGWRGELTVLDGEATRSIFFDAGNVVAAHSNAVGERAAHIMYKLGALSEDQVDAATRAQERTPQRKFADVVIELGLLPRERVFELLAKQAEEIVHASLRVGDGTFFFLDGFDDARLVMQHHLPAAGLLMEGVRRMDEVKYFRERIPSDAYVPVPTPGRTDVPAPLAAVFQACDGKRNVTDLGRACGLTPFESTHAVFQLVQAGLVQMRAPLPTSVEAIVAIFNEAMRAIFSAVETTGAGEAFRAQLSMYASTAGIYDVLFMGAGPRADGTLDDARIGRNVKTLVQDDDPEEQLGEWLYDYAAYALFNASGGLSTEAEQALSKQVHERIRLLAPRSTRG
jgi:hypothetical protein